MIVHLCYALVAHYLINLGILDWYNSGRDKQLIGME